MKIDRLEAHLERTLKRPLTREEQTTMVVARMDAANGLSPKKAAKAVQRIMLTAAAKAKVGE